MTGPKAAEVVGSVATATPTDWVMAIAALIGSISGLVGASAATINALTARRKQKHSEKNNDDV